MDCVASRFNAVVFAILRVTAGEISHVDGNFPAIGGAMDRDAASVRLLSSLNCERIDKYARTPLQTP